jgi:peptide/nickel transport system ATP-binding protein/oligopeptide transport system ATP-binding protein
MSEPILQIKDLKVYFHLNEGVVKAVDGVSYQLNRGETLGLVGESGCGKSVSALSILQLIDRPPAEIHSGEIHFEDKDLLELTEKGMRSVRGCSISMIFQEPMTSLNPVLSIGFQIAEVLVLHQNMAYKEAIERTVDLLRLVGIPSPERRVKEYPHQLSGGMRQRTMIALAIGCSPKVLIADEPTTALDVTTQAQILELMMGLQKELGTAILLITHDLGIIAETANRVAVMYAGKIVEEADVITIFKDPLHPYTRGLLKSVPRIDKTDQRSRLEEIPGVVPDLSRLPEGCSFFERCNMRDKRCRPQEPELRPAGEGHLVRCWLYGNG